MAQIDVKVVATADTTGFQKTAAAASDLEKNLGRVGQNLGGIGQQTQRATGEVDQMVHHIERAFSGSKFSHGLMAAFGIGTGGAAIEHMIEKWVDLFKQADESMKEMAEEAEKMAATFERLAKTRLDLAMGRMTPEQQIEQLKKENEELEKKMELQAQIKARALADVTAAGAAPFGTIGATAFDPTQGRYGYGGMSGVAERAAKVADQAQEKWAKLAEQVAVNQAKMEALGKTVSKQKEEEVKAANETAANEIRNALAVEDAQKKADAAAEANLDTQADKWTKAGDSLLQYRLDLAEIIKLQEAGKLTADEAYKAMAKLMEEHKMLNPGGGGRVNVTPADPTRQLRATAFYESGAAYSSLSDPTQHLQSTKAGAQAGLLDYMARAGTLADQVASGIENTIGTAVQSVAQGITGWIMGVQTFGQALLNIGNTILTTILETIIQMGVRMMINAVLGRTLSAAAAAASIAIVAATAPAISALWATPAALATIATMGGAAFQAPAAIMTAEIATLATAGFEQGGYTGAGARGDIAGVVHRGEYVLPAWMVSSPQFGGVISSLEAARSGGISAITRPGFAPDSPQPNFVFLVDQQRFAQSMQENMRDWHFDLTAQFVRKAGAG